MRSSVIFYSHSCFATLLPDSKMNYMHVINISYRLWLFSHLFQNRNRYWSVQAIIQFMNTMRLLSAGSCVCVFAQYYWNVSARGCPTNHIRDNPITQIYIKDAHRKRPIAVLQPQHYELHHHLPPRAPISAQSVGFPSWEFLPTILTMFVLRCLTNDTPDRCWNAKSRLMAKKRRWKRVTTCVRFWEWVCVCVVCLLNAIIITQPKERISVEFVLYCQ